MTLRSLQPGEVLLNRDAADELQASPGDALVLYSPVTQMAATVRDVIAYDGMGTPDSGLLMALTEAQLLFGKQGQIKHVVISNDGDSQGGASHTDAVIAGLTPTLTALVWQSSRRSAKTLHRRMRQAPLFSTIFITFGSFSIAAGILLIFLLFVMLAGERKPEMGIARAVGTERVHLVEMFMFEGLLYDVAAAAVGALAGMAVAYAMVSGVSQCFRAVQRRYQVHGKHTQSGYSVRDGRGPYFHRRHSLGVAGQPAQHCHRDP